METSLWLIHYFFASFKLNHLTDEYLKKSGGQPKGFQVKMVFCCF